MAKKLKGWTQDNVEILKISDGDTITVRVTKDIGFDMEVRRKMKLRIRDFDAPETQRPRNDAEKQHGLMATGMAKELLLNKKITLITYKKGKYGRFEADIILEDGRDFVDVMVEAGLAKREKYDGV